MGTSRSFIRIAPLLVLLVSAGCSDDPLYPEDFGLEGSGVDARVVSLAPRLAPDQVRLRVDPPLSLIELDPPQYSPFISVREDWLFRLSKGGSLKPAAVTDFGAGDSIRVWFQRFGGFGGEEVAAVALIR